MLCLSVPVDNVVAMEVGEGRYDLGRVEPHTGQGKLPGRSEVIEKFPTGHVGEQQVEVSSVYTGPEELYQEGVFGVLKQSVVAPHQLLIILHLQYFLLVLHVLSLLQLQDFLN